MCGCDQNYSSKKKMSRRKSRVRSRKMQRSKSVEIKNFNISSSGEIQYSNNTFNGIEVTFLNTKKEICIVRYISANIDIDWKSAETVDAVDIWDVAVRKKSVGMPLEQILLELGYDPEIAKIIADNASTANAAAQQAQNPTQISLRGTGLNANNLAMQEAAADNNQ